MSVLRFALVGGAERGLDPPREGDAGFDLRAASGGVIPPGGSAVVDTAVKVAVPGGWVGLVKDRSSMAARRIYTHGGVIDSGYRGIVRLVLSNGAAEPFAYDAGDRLAQLVVVPCLTDGAAVAEEDLDPTPRGPLGFGSTGRS